MHLNVLFVKKGKNDKIISVWMNVTKIIIFTKEFVRIVVKNSKIVINVLMKIVMNVNKIIIC